MKTVRRILFVSAAMLFFNAASHAQVIVKERMIHHVDPADRPARPASNRNWMWVSDEWVAKGNTYVERPGRWEVPPRRGVVWVAGYWESRGKGFAWKPGHWSK